MGAEPPINEDEDGDGTEPGSHEHSWSKRPNWPAVINLATHIVVFASGLVDILSRF
jgi:hypothetical protein